MLAIAPYNKNTQGLLDTLTNQLFARAKQQLANQRYTTPKDDNAVDTFQQILKISPDNVEAQDNIDKIVKRYYRLAITKYRQARYKGSMTWIKRGLLVAPDDPQLNDLKQKVMERL